MWRTLPWLDGGRQSHDDGRQYLVLRIHDTAMPFSPSFGRTGHAQ
jgi:hypothetical protein